MSSPVNPFETPQADIQPVPAVEQDHPLAERSSRLVASILDSLVHVPPALAGYLVGMLFGEVAALILALVAFFAMAIYQWYLISTTGQSLAKRWMGLKILRDDGGEVDFVTGVVLRIWAVVGLSFVPFIGSFVGLLDALMIFSEDRKCLHDRIAKTKVIVLE